MTTSTSLIDLILSLLRDPAQRAAFQQDPQAFLASCGDISPEDVRDAITLAQDSEDSDNGHHHTGGHHVHVAPPPPVHHDDDSGDSDHEAAVKYLNTYITNNYVDHRETNVDNSIHQNIDNRGGHFNQDIDVDSTVASGDHSVAAGHDVSGTVTTGNHNQVGDHNVAGDRNVTGNNNNAVTGDDNTTSFGSGHASSTHVGGDVAVGSGGAFSGAGDAAVHDTDQSVNGSFNDQSHHSTDHSFNSTVDHSDHSDHSIDDSYNPHTDQSHHTDTATDHSFNTDVH